MLCVPGTPGGLVTKVERFADAAKKELVSSLAVAYDYVGLPVSYTDQCGRVKKFERDAFGRVVKVNPGTPHLFPGTK